MKYQTLIAALLFSVLRAFGQITPPPTPQFPTWHPLGINGMPTAPQPATLAPHVTIGFPSQQPQMPGTINPFAPNAQTQRNNELIM
jgi:hypothetical protein